MRSTSWEVKRPLMIEVPRSAPLSTGAEMTQSLRTMASCRST